MATITGTSGNDNLTGTSGNDEMSGREGNDVLEGGDGDDFILGDEGEDILRGGAGNDRFNDLGGSIYGEDGNDWIQIRGPDEAGIAIASGGRGNDLIEVTAFGVGHVSVDGGSGSDTIALAHIMGSVDMTLGSGRDTVRLDFNKDFESALFRYDALTIDDFVAGSNGDLIDWENFLGIHLATWDQTTNPFTTGHLLLKKSGDDTLVQVDGDGGGDGYQTLLTLRGVSLLALTAENFDGYDPRGTQAVGAVIRITEFMPEIRGTLGADHISFVRPSAVVWGGGGSDTIIGWTGADQLRGEVGHDVIEGREGDDLLDGGTGNDRLIGGSGNDGLYGSTGDDRLEGGEGDDMLVDDFGHDVLLGGAGDDTLEDNYSVSGQLDGGDGNDVIRVLAANHVVGFSISGGNGNDSISIQTYNSPSVGAGFEIDAGAGADRVTIQAHYGDVRVILGSGTDSVSFGTTRPNAGPAISLADFVPGLFGDRFDWTGTLEAWLRNWDGSNPFLSGHLKLVQSGTDTILYLDEDAAQSDFLPVAVAILEDVIAYDLTTENFGGYSPIAVRNGTSRANTLQGRNAAERLNGFEGNDVLLGSGGNDLLVGDSGNDRLDGGTGADGSYGGTGDDVHVIDNVADRVFELSGQGVDRVESSVAFTLSNDFENLTLLGAAAINGDGNSAANTLIGNSAANRLRGMGGNDILDGAGGVDRLEGGKGGDAYRVDNSADLVIEKSGQGADTVWSTAGFTLGDHVENLTLTGTAEIDGTGNGLANVLTGNDARNRLDGGLGADTMIGGKGNDFYIVDNYGDRVIEAAAGGNDAIYSSVSYTLPSQVEKLFLTGTKTLEGRGNAASNTIVGTSNGNVLKGNDGHDKIDGGGSHDRLYGGNGNDILTGGLGNDGFYFDTKLASSNVDSLTDFLPAKDTIYLSAKIFRGIAGGTLPASAFHQGSAAADAADRIVYEAASGRIFYDADGTGAAAQILFATVTPGTALTSADFVV